MAHRKLVRYSSSDEEMEKAFAATAAISESEAQLQCLEDLSNATDAAPSDEDERIASEDDAPRAHGEAEEGDGSADEAREVCDRCNARFVCGYNCRLCNDGVCHMMHGDHLGTLPKAHEWGCFWHYGACSQCHVQRFGTCTVNNAWRDELCDECFTEEYEGAIMSDAALLPSVAVLNWADNAMP